MESKLVMKVPMQYNRLSVVLGLNLPIRARPPKHGGCLVLLDQNFNLLMEMAHPLFKLVDDSWKLKRFAMQAYPAWHTIHLDEDCWLLLKGKKAVKMEVNENAVSGQ
ncbi:hypothetical protein PAXRUDRAFT_771159, partial [Paxillus rubicundulus Ve08.2h10]